MKDSATPAVVVGVDGAMADLHAALWAVDEALSHDIPLRLVHAIDADDPEDLSTTTRKRAAAASAVRHVIAAVEATGKPVKVEVDIAGGPPISTLVRASRSAAMVCVGAVGANHFRPDRVGSTAATIAASAYCPVAIIRGHGRPKRPTANWILVEVDTSPDNGILLEAAVTEAGLRDAPLRVIACLPTSFKRHWAVAEEDRRIRARVARRLPLWRRRYPELQIELDVVHGCSLGYLAENAADVQLLVVSARDPQHLRRVLGPVGSAALRDSDCAVLVVDHQHL